MSQDERGPERFEPVSGTEPGDEGTPQQEGAAPSGQPVANAPWGHGQPAQPTQPTQPGAWPTQPTQPGAWQPPQPGGWQPGGWQPGGWQPGGWQPAQPSWPPQQPAQPSWPPQQPAQPSWPPALPAAPSEPSGSTWPSAIEHRPPKRSRLTLPIIGVIAAALIAFGGGIAVGRALSPAGPSTSAQPLTGFEVYDEALQKVKQNFVNRSSLDDKTLVYGSIRGMIDALGDTGHSRFMTPEEYQAERQSLSGELIGIGVMGGDLDGVPTIIRVLPDSPADKAGVKAGDRITAVDGTSTTGLTFDQIAGKIRGPAGTSVTLSLLHSGATSPVDVKITRAKIHVPLVSWHLVPGTKTADIVLTGFDSGAGDQVKQAIAEAQAQGATSIVFDLRGNPGGYVNEAIDVASLFLSSGNVFIEVDAQGKRTEMPVDSKQTHTSLPLVVLVDNNSASAAEIVAGAIQDAHRGKIVGVRTFGTGTVLDSFPLSDGSALFLGIRKFETPSGRQILNNGVPPDELVALPLGVTPLDASELAGMSASEFQATKDSQLLAAVKALQ